MRMNKVDGRNVITWRCPFYRRWSKLFERSYGRWVKEQKPCYQDTTVAKEWHLFSNFEAWMQQQDWEGKHLDKDLLVPGNREYGPETCCFISPQVNTFLAIAKYGKRNLPTGVYVTKNGTRFYATITTGDKQKFLGAFSTPEEAHTAWLHAKIDYADYLATLESNPRIADALRQRFRNYVDPWFEDQNLPLAA